VAEVGAKRIVEIDPQNGNVTEIAGNLLPVEAVLAQIRKTIPACGSALPAMAHQTAPTRGSGANWAVKIGKPLG
jgi:hypothetical protein